MRKDSKKKARKQQERLKRAYARQNREDSFSQRHPFLSNVWKKNMKPLLLVVIVLAIVAIGYLGYSMYKQYQDSLYWEDHHDKNVLMADQPPSLLYDKDPTSKNAKLDFLSIYQTVYDDERMDFTKKVQQDAISQLEKELGRMADDEYKKEYQQLYDTVSQKWAIESQYRSLYTDASLKTLKDSTTPHEIVALNNKTFEKIDEYSMDSTHHDQFAIRMYDWQHRLLKDAFKLETKAEDLSKWLTKKEGKWSVQPDLYPAQFKEYVASVESLELNYKWNSLDKLYSILKAINPITEQYAKRHDTYQKVNADKAEGKQALAQVDARLADEQATLNTVMANIENERSAYVNQAASIEAQISQLDERLATREQQVEKEVEQRLEAKKQAEKDAEAKASEEAAAKSSSSESSRSESTASSSSKPDSSSQSSDSTQDSSTSSDESTVDSSDQVADPDLDTYKGKPALDVFDTLTYSFTYDRKSGVETDLSNGVIEGYTIKEDGTVHFTIAPKK